MSVYDLWMEGYAATGTSSDASFIGTFEANSFLEACDKWASTLTDEQRRLYYEPYLGRPAYWGCRIFDNEIEARRSFG